MLKRFIAHTVLANIFMAQAAFAEPADQDSDIVPLSDYDFPACTDKRSEEVVYLRADKVHIHPYVMEAGARYLETNPISKPAIFYEYEFFEELPSVARDFSFAHECYHLSSGDALSAYEYKQKHDDYKEREDMMEVEDRADCHAAGRLKNEFGYTAKDLEVLEKAIDSMDSNDHTQRMQKIQTCFKNGGPA
ncbi:MAG: hypothetical protein ACQEQL_01245 [Pseudomonadota bacterium]